ncbi:MAG: GAK system XXXCH domain-containing protein [Desulfohalobiaceae bacterium]
MSKKRRYEFELNRKEAVQALRELAQSLEEQSTEVPDLEVDLSQMRKIKFSLKEEAEGQFQLKVKVTPWKQEEIEEEEGEEAGFARLKKRMKAYFEELEANLHSELYPSREIVSVFLQDCRQMTEYPGYGEEHYPDFQQACLEFQKAFDMEDIQAMQVAFASLSNLMHSCHERYK